MNLTTIIDLATTHARANENAILSLLDALNLKDQGMKREAARRALVSLKYSVGIFHEHYKTAEQLFNTMD